MLLNRTIFINRQSPELFAQTLKDGVVLCEIANELLKRKSEQSNTIKYKVSTMPFVQVRDKTVLGRAWLIEPLAGKYFDIPSIC